MMYIFLAAGIAATLVSLVARRKAPKLGVAFQIITLVALLAAGVYYYLAVQPYDSFLQSISSIFG